MKLKVGDRVRIYEHEWQKSAGRFPKDFCLIVSVGKYLSKNIKHYWVSYYYRGRIYDDLVGYEWELKEGFIF